MIQTQGMDRAMARGVSSCPEHNPRLLQNFPPGAAFTPHQLSWVEQGANQIQTREGQLFTDCLSLQFLTQMKHAGSYA